MTNKSIRDYAKSKSVYLWQVALKMNVSEPTITRKLRMELSDAESSKMMRYIDEIANEKEREV